MSSTTSNARFNVGLLAACQAMLLTNNATLIAIVIMALVFLYFRKKEADA